jgi:hypothetical protein
MTALGPVSRASASSARSWSEDGVRLTQKMQVGPIMMHPCGDTAGEGCSRPNPMGSGSPGPRRAARPRPPAPRSGRPRPAAPARRPPHLPAPATGLHQPFETATAGSGPLRAHTNAARKADSTVRNAKGAHTPRAAPDPRQTTRPAPPARRRRCPVARGESVIKC